MKQKILIDRDNCDFGWYGLCFGQVVLSLIFDLGEIEDWIHPDSDLKQIWWKSRDERFWMQKKMQPVNTSVELMEGSKKTLPSAHILKIGKFYHFVREKFWLSHLKFWQEFTRIFNIFFISFSPSSTFSQLTAVIWKIAFLKSISWWHFRTSSLSCSLITRSLSGVRCPHFKVTYLACLSSFRLSTDCWSNEDDYTKKWRPLSFFFSFQNLSDYLQGNIDWQAAIDVPQKNYVISNSANVNISHFVHPANLGCQRLLH